MDYELEINKIKGRNRKVEADKAWETSLYRKISNAVITYLFMSLFLAAIGSSNPFSNSLVPTLGYLLSTLSLNVLKNFWIKRREANKPENHFNSEASP